MPYKSYRTNKRKIKSNWEDTEKNLSEAQNIVKQQLIDFSMIQKNQEIFDFIVLQDESISNIFFPQTFEVTIFNIPLELISSIYVFEQLYRTPDIQSAIFNRITRKEIFIKQIENGVLLQIILPFVGLTNRTLREIKVYINNHIKISSIQKITI